MRLGCFRRSGGLSLTARPPPGAIAAAADLPVAAVAGRLSDPQVEKDEHGRAETDLRQARQAYTPPPSRNELEKLIREAGDLVTILARADASDRRGLYTALGLRLTYEPGRRTVAVECSPDSED